jgi:pimeloyl-ACP methyl ester carboxylesterase
MTPTVVLVHGAFAESSSWNDVADRLVDEGHRVIAYANPLRSVAGDAAGLTELVRTIDGPIVLAGHSYGGAVITNVPADAGEIVGLVYVAAFALDAGESCADASTGGSLGDTLHTVALPTGIDLYIRQELYHEQFCADLPERQAQLMAITQRPILESALAEASGDAPLWKAVPSWFVFGELDRNIPAAQHRRMADRAGSRRTIEVAGASHVVGVSHPTETAELILEAANAASPAHSDS